MDQPGLEIEAHGLKMVTLQPTSWNDLDRIVDISQGMSSLMCGDFPEDVNRDSMMWVTKSSPTQAFYTIEVDGTVSGVIGYYVDTGIERHNGEVFGWGGKDYWRKGHSREAIKKFTQLAFNTSSLERLYARVFATNNVILNGLKKSGWRKEGYLKQAAIKNGQLKDVVLFAITRGEI